MYCLQQHLTTHPTGRANSESVIGNLWVSAAWARRLFILNYDHKTHRSIGFQKRLRGGPRVSSVVRSKTADGKIHLFPYGQLVSASLVRTEDSEIVRIAFANSDVEITGRNLRDLFHALQDFAVKWVRAMPARYQALGEGTAGSFREFVSLPRTDQRKLFPSAAAR